ncbi:elongation factor P [bacterium]|nr:elongation factor P [bacterium]
MAFVSSNDLSTGITVDIDGDLLQVIEFQHVKPGKGSPFVRAKFKNIKTGYTKEFTFRGNEKMTRAHIERRPASFLYAQDDEYTFMDSESYDQHAVTGKEVGDQKKWLKDGMEVMLVLYNDAIIGIELPNFVELVVVETEPGFKGDTATGATKPATVEGGATVLVPLFVDVGTKLMIDTRTGEYMKRV